MENKWITIMNPFDGVVAFYEIPEDERGMDIEDIIVDKLGYDLSNIDYMVTTTQPQIYYLHRD